MYKIILIKKYEKKKADFNIYLYVFDSHINNRL